MKVEKDKLSPAEQRWATLLAYKIGKGLGDIESIKKKSLRYSRISRYHVSCICHTFLEGGCNVNDVIGICSQWLRPDLCKRRLQYQRRKLNEL